MKLSMRQCDILMALAIKRISYLPHHLSYVSTLPDITQKPKSCCLPLNSLKWL